MKGIYIKLDLDVLDYFKAAGRGYQKRINAALRSAMNKEIGSEISGATPRAIAHAQVAFERYYSQAFWHHRRDAVITSQMIPVVVAGLKRYGGRSGFQEAESICRLMNSKS